MYIEELKIQQVKLIRDQTISFMRGDQPRMWTVIVGENGSCKTTVLQAIALAALGPDGANRITNAASFHDRRIKGDAVIFARFGFGELRHGSRKYPGLDPRPDHIPRLVSTIFVGDGWEFFSGVSGYRGADRNRVPVTPQMEDVPMAFVIREARGQNYADWLVAGYGTTRALPVPKSIERPTNAAVERLRSLFEPTQIIGTGFADLFEGTLVKAYVRELKNALTLQDQILPRIRDLELRGRHGVGSASRLVEAHRFAFDTGKDHDALKIPATWLSQGYQAMIAWIADLVGQFFADRQAKVPLDEMEGLILIDELDIHLHPTWQRGLITALKATFPRVQFVVTTHTAMVLPGLEADEILRTRFDDEGNVVVEPVNQSPDYMTGSEILSTFFGIDSLFPSEAGEALQLYAYLSNNPGRSDEEEQQLQKAMSILKTEGVEPGWEPVPRNGTPASSVPKAKRAPRKGRKKP